MTLSPRIVRNIKTLFHALTVAAAAIASLGIGSAGGFGGMIPERYAIYVMLGSSVISGLLNLLTRNFPWLATPDTSDDPPSEDPVSVPTPGPTPSPVPPAPVPDRYYPTQYATLALAEGSGTRGDSVYRHPKLPIFYLFPQFGSPFYESAIRSQGLTLVGRV
jgi:hypothetical protein